MEKEIIGYKGFDKDLKGINNFQYEIGKVYEIDEVPKLAEIDFHYCNTIEDVFRYNDSDCRICKVKVLGDIDSDEYNSCTNKIEILEEIEVSKEDRIRYAYALYYDLSENETKELFAEEFKLDKYINDPNWPIRSTVARQGYGLNVLINDPNPEVRIDVANQGYGLDKLVNDENWMIRKMVAKQGYSLDVLINDPSPEVRVTIATQEYGLDELINDEDWRVSTTALNSIAKHPDLMHKIQEDIKEYFQNT